MPQGAPYEIRVTGVRRTPLRDLYHAVLRWSWARTLLFISVAYLALNAVFAAAYALVGGVGNAHGSFLSDFFFSVQTMGTIGYGAMYPESTPANIVVVAESLASLLFTALATGVVFAKFSRTRARVVFADKAVVSLNDGVPTLMLRVGNERGNLIVDAQVRMVVSLTEQTAEGAVFFRTYDVHPVRERLMTLSRSFTILCPIKEGSPLHGLGPAALEQKEAEIYVTVLGLDDATMQPVHAQTRYFPRDIVWGARYADILSDLPDGNMLMDLTKFHDIVRTEPTPAFPYP